MRFLIATGIYPPEIGGPAFYAKNLADSLREKGHVVEIGTFGTLKKLPSGLRHLALFFRLLPLTGRTDMVIALDTFSAELPAFFAAKLFRKPFIVRTGGDFIWERYIERTGDLVPLPHFYERRAGLDMLEKLYFRLTAFSLRRAYVVFSTRFQKDIWEDAYRLDGKKTCIIENAITGSFEPIAPTRKNFLFYSREIRLKNGPVLRKAFELAKKQVPDIVLEEGQVPQKELLEHIRRSYAVILPSISEISPNYILDAIRCGKPFILTKYSEYASLYGDLGLIVDPLSVEDIAAKIVELCDEKKYAELVARISAQKLTRTYAQLADDFIALAQKLV